MTRTASHLCRRIVTLLVVASCLITSIRAEDVYVSSFIGGTQNSCPPSCAVTGTGTTTTTVSSAPGVPARTRALIGVVTTASWTVTPTLLQSAGTYRIYITKGTSGNGSPNLVVNMTTTGGDLADIGGAGGSSIPLTNFNASSANNTWILVGYLTNNTTTPAIAFNYASGAAAGTAGRWYMDVVRFENLDPCTGIAPLAEATGPLGAGQTEVTVTGVAAGATNVTVYANTIQIGATNYAAGFAAGSLTVPTSALVKDEEITATQIKTNGLGSPCTSQPAATGAVVGGGANPRIKVSLGVLQNAALTGPAGANTTGTGTGYWLKASALQAGSASAPVGGQEIIPGQCWELVTFKWGTDSGLNWQTGGAVNDANPYAALEHLAIAIDDTDTGPYDIYIDSIMNGDTVIEDFESYSDGTPNVTFVAPNVATVPNPGPTYLSAPNSSAISQAHAFDGVNSCRVRWQFKDSQNVRWVRLLAGASTGKKYPQLDTHQPVTVRLLVLPVGQTVSHKFNGTVGSITNTAPPVYVGTTNVLGVTVSGPGTYTYQWSWSNGGLSNPSTDRTYTIDGGGAGVSAVDNGTYTVQVSDGTCTETRTFAFTAADPIPTITNQPAQAIISPGSTVAVMSVGANGHVPLGYPLTYQWRANGSDVAGQTLDTLWITNASTADVLGYDVVVANGYGSVTSALATVDVVAVAPGTGTGLRGDYRTSHFSTNAFGGTPTLTRVDPTVNFNFGNGTPDPSISADFFSARWTGQVQALGTDTYTFYTISDDGVRLWVNGQLLIENWTLHGPTTNSGSIALTGTTKYNVTFEYFENGVTAVAQLYWSNAGGTVGFEPIPKSQLYPAAAGVVIPSFTYSQPDTNHLVFNWGVGTYNLTWATNVAGPYTNVIYGVTSPYTNAIGHEPQKYFRLQVQ